MMLILCLFYTTTFYFYILPAQPIRTKLTSILKCHEYYWAASWLESTFVQPGLQPASSDMSQQPQGYKYQTCNLKVIGAVRWFGGSNWGVAEKNKKKQVRLTHVHQVTLANPSAGLAERFGGGGVLGGGGGIGGRDNVDVGVAELCTSLTFSFCKRPLYK